MSNLSAAKIRPLGCWMLLRAIPPKDEWWTIAGLTDGLFHADGTGEQRTTFGRAEVVAVGPGGFVEDKGQREANNEREKKGLKRKPKRLRPDPALKPGATAIFRGYLAEYMQPCPLDDPNLFFAHFLSVEGVEEEEIEYKFAEIGDATIAGVDLASGPDKTVVVHADVSEDNEIGNIELSELDDGSDDFELEAVEKPEDEVVFDEDAPPSSLVLSAGAAPRTRKFKAKGGSELIREVAERFKE